MKKYTERQYAKALYEACHTLSGRALEEAVRVFALRVKRDGRWSIMKRIVENFALYAEKREGRQPLAVTTRFGLDGKTKKLLARVFGDDALLKEAIDERMLGGIIVQSGDTVYNASAKMQVARLKQALIGD